MTMHTKNPAVGAAGLENASLPGGIDCTSNAPEIAPAQEDNRASEITCASMRMDELREGLVRDISHLMALGLAAQEALHAGDDEAALIWLRKHWLVMRADVSPRAAELRDLAGGRP
jgi:hypothetical protein